MAYIDKKSLLTAYKILSHNTNSPSSQGATQFISAIRYLFALDRFILKTNKNCDTKEKEDRELFINYIGDVVSIDTHLLGAEHLVSGAGEVTQQEGDKCHGDNHRQEDSALGS